MRKSNAKENILCKKHFGIWFWEHDHPFCLFRRDNINGGDTVFKGAAFDMATSLEGRHTLIHHRIPWCYIGWNRLNYNANFKSKCCSKPNFAFSYVILSNKRIIHPKLNNILHYQYIKTSFSPSPRSIILKILHCLICMYCYCTKWYWFISPNDQIRTNWLK